MTINDLAKLIIEICDSKSKIKYRDPRLGDVKTSMASVEKLKSTGWSPKFQFKPSLKNTVDYFLSINNKDKKI
jgi:nucleoside-diphosphate-sugar epimerase